MSLRSTEPLCLQHYPPSRYSDHSTLYHSAKPHSRLYHFDTANKLRPCLTLRSRYTRSLLFNNSPNRRVARCRPLLLLPFLQLVFCFDYGSFFPPSCFMITLVQPFVRKLRSSLFGASVGTRFFVLVPLLVIFCGSSCSQLMNGSLLFHDLIICAMSKIMG